MSKNKNITAFIALLLVLIGTIYLGGHLKNLSFKYDIESFFDLESEDTKYYHAYRDQFGHENNFLLIGISAEKDVFDPVFFQQLDSLSLQLKSIEGVNEVISPSNVKRVIVSPFGNVVKFPLIRGDDYFEKDLEEIYRTKSINQGLFSSDSSAVMIYLKKSDDFSFAENNDLLFKIKNRIEKNGFKQYYLAGRINTQNYYISTMASEMKFFILSSLILLLAFLILTYRNFWLIVLPIIVVVLGAFWTMGTVSLAGHQMDLMMIILPSLIFVLGISNSIHLISKYRQTYNEIPDKSRRIKYVVKETGVANFLTSVTTAVGFLCLLTIPVTPIKYFGLFAAIGVMITFVVSLLLVPSLLYLINPKPKLKDNHLDAFWEKLLNKIYLNVLRNGRKYMAGTLITVLVSILLLPMINLNNFFLDDLSEDSSLKKELRFFEEKFNGIRPFEIGVKIKGENTLFDEHVIEELSLLEAEVEKIYETKGIIGPVEILSCIWQALNDGSNDMYRVPSNQKEIKKVKRAFKKYKLDKKLSNFISKENNWLRISASTKDLGSSAFMEKHATLAELSKTFQYIEVRPTGTAYLADQTNHNISLNLVEGLLTAIALIVILIGFLFRSLKVALLSLIPNLFPLLVAGGAMAILGIDLKISTAVIFTISLGIAVDDTIHFLFKVRKEFKKEENIFKAVKRTFLSTGKALVVTSFVLISGFIVFVFSDFNSLKSIGSLVSLTLLVALIADLFLLPPILMRVYRKKKMSKRRHA